MDDLIKLVKTYRFTTAVDQRMRLAGEICQQIHPKLRSFVYGSVTPNAAPDVLQDVLVGVAKSLRTFAGSTNGEFWKWCYTIARYKIADQIRRRASDRLQPMSPEDMQQLLDDSSKISVRTPGVSHDLDYAMKVLTNAKPECHGLLWGYYVQDVGYAELADERGITYDAVRMQIKRCLEEARALLA